MLFSRFYGGWAKYQKPEKQEIMLSFKEENKKGTSSASWISILKKKGEKKFGNAVCKCLDNKCNGVKGKIQFDMNVEDRS